MKVQSLEFGSCQLSWSPKPQEMKEIWPHILPISSGRNQFKGKICIKDGWKIKIPLHLPNTRNFSPFRPLFICPSRGRPYYVIGYGGRAAVHTGFRTMTSSVYWIFTKLCHMIPLWKGKNPIYFVVKFGKDPIYRTKVIVRKRPCCQKLYL